MANQIYKRMLNDFELGKTMKKPNKPRYLLNERMLDGYLAYTITTGILRLPS